MSYATFLQVRTEAIKRLRVLTTDLPYIDLINSFINQTHKDVLQAHDYPFTALQGQAMTTAPVMITSATWVTLTQNLISVSPALTASNIGHYIQLSGSQDLYKVIAIPSAGSVTLGVPISLPSTTAGSGIMFPASYPLPSNFRMPSVVNTVFSRYGLTFIGSREYSEMLVRGTIGPPSHWSIIYDSVTPVSSTPPLPRLAFYPVSDRPYVYQFEYRPLVSDLLLDADLILIPDGYRESLVFGAMKRFYREVLDNEESASHSEQQEFYFTNRLSSDFGFFDDPIKLIPSVRRQSHGRQRVQ